MDSFPPEASHPSSSQLSAHVFCALDLPKVQGFFCGDEHPWEVDGAAWIKNDPLLVSDCALNAISLRETSVWLYENASDGLVGYGSLGPTKWSIAHPSEARRKISLIPWVAVQKAYWGKPDGAPADQRFGMQIMDDLIARAFELAQSGSREPYLGLFVDERNKRAIKFYERLEFATLSSPYVDGESVFLRMLLRLN